MEETKQTGKIEDLKPVDGMKLAEYLQTIKQKNTPEQYYVPYNVANAKNLKLNYYVENKINYLAVEYEMPSKSGEETQHIKLIMAKHKNTIGNIEEVEKILNNFFKSSKIYATTNAVDPTAYITKLTKMGWEFTPEGIELMQVTKHQGDVEIKRTEFTEAEIEDFSNNNTIEENKRQHIDRTEGELIEGIKEYIIHTYQQMPDGISEELETYKEKVQKYTTIQKRGKESKTDLLSVMFRELKPIKESTPIIPLMQKSYNQNIEGYLDMIPVVYRDRTNHEHYREYMVAREIAVREKEENGKVLPENSLAEEKIEKLVTVIDNEKTKESEEKIGNIQKKVSKKLQVNNKAREGMEIA